MPPLTSAASPAPERCELEYVFGEKKEGKEKKNKKAKGKMAAGRDN